MVWAGIVAGICNFIYSNSFLDGNHWMISVFYCTPIAFLTAFFIFGFFFFFSKRITPNSRIGLGKLVILSTVSGVISAIAWQLVSLLID